MAPPVVGPVGGAVDASATDGVDGCVGRDDPVPGRVVVVWRVDTGGVGVEGGAGPGERPVAADRRGGPTDAAPGPGRSGSLARLNPLKPSAPLPNTIELTSYCVLSFRL